MSLSDYGSLASIFGIAISGFTLIMMFYIKKKFLFRSRVEEFGDRLTIISSDITSCLNSYDLNKDKVDELVALADVALRSVQKGASGDLNSDLTKARRQTRIYKIRDFLGGRFKPESKHARNVSKSLNVVVAELQNVKRELMAGK
ncbi:hypothetical protein [Photobacterium chitinilyticum]|uniref:Uncharacterized protein n=1 Tax=Photobacterium chitinilyticum TaxID=2485123 RepID=A0A3S3T1R7_9GAMM|nr:hypothetical protein [Photobacterium chitinilyticum]RWX57205.1 hypothetical protein EDI28_04015 [Photobacterium chitinilyticum]